MKKINWLPLLCTLFLFSLFFIENIPDYGKDIYEAENQIECSQTALIDLEDFEDYLYELKMGAVGFSKEELIDTTGDGEREIVRSSVRLHQSECLVTQEIIKDGEHIWKKEISLNQSHLRRFFNNDPNLTKNVDQALLYLGLSFSNFVEKLPKNSNFDDVSKRLARNHFKEMPMDLLEMYNSKVKTDIDNYTGNYIFDRQLGNEAVYMWDNEKASFELLCELQKEFHLI